MTKVSKRTFVVDFEGSVTIELDTRVIDAVNDEWRKEMYPLHTPEQIAQHIVYNMVKNGIRLESMDGWADQPNERARIIDESEWELAATEIKKGRKQTKKTKRRS